MGLTCTFVVAGFVQPISVSCDSPVASLPSTGLSPQLGTRAFHTSTLEVIFKLRIAHSDTEFPRVDVCVSVHQFSGQRWTIQPCSTRQAWIPARKRYGS
jgi:hypothetical protein